jgi:hypothetical protein
MSDMGGQNRRCWPISFLSGRPLRIMIMCCSIKRSFAESTSVPTFRKRNDWPSGSRRFVEAQNVLLLGGCHDHSQGIQHQIQFNLAHRAFPVRERRVFVRAHRNFPQNS